MSDAGRIWTLLLLAWLAPASALAQGDYPNRTDQDRGAARAGRLRALAIANEERLAEFPDLPIMAETYPGFVATGWFALLAPPKTPAAIVDKLWQAVAEALRMPDVEARLRGIGAAPGGSTPAATAAFLRQETERWSKVIAQANIKPE